MKNNFTCRLYKTVLSVLFLFGSFNSFGDHINGAYLSYTYVSGSTYKITLTVYGRCSPASGAGFTTLLYATPQIVIYNGGTYTDSIHLVVQPPDTGIEITPLCPGEISQCLSPSSSIPGMRRFVYSGNYTVPSASAAWRFIFNGYMGSATAAGREAAITNLLNPGTTIMQLEDTLNNSVYNSTSPTINSIPMLFAVNEYNTYNPTAVDSAGDALTYMLVAPINGTETSTPGTAVGYVPGGIAWPGQPLSTTTPLQVLAGSYSMNSATGQMIFDPNVLQRSIVVYNIEARRAGTLVGTSQFEINIGIALDTGTGGYLLAPYVGPASYSPSCGSTPDTVSVSASISGCGTSGFQWQSSPDNVTWTNIAGATAAMYTYTPGADLYFRCFQTNTILGDTSYSASVYAPVSAANLMHWSIVNIADTLCDASIFYVSACDTSSFDTVTTYFGDGTSGMTPLALTGGVYSADVSHWYSSPGTFMVKQVLSNGGLPVDSVTYPYNYFYCRILQAQFYYDVDSNCVYNNTVDFLNYFPLTVEIDSNGVALDTVSATSGIYYTAYGGPGTIYSFKVLSTIYGLSVSCPLSGILSDTIASSISIYPIRYFGLRATPGTTGFDLVNNTSLTCSPLAACGSILVYNSYPIPVPSTLTMTFSNKYTFNSASPAPSSVVGNTVTWNVGLLSSYVPMTLIELSLVNTGPGPIPFGDTINVNSVLTPITGDVNPANNSYVTVDTVNSAFDPNYMAVSPEGYISSGTQLQYTIHFENTGNDTAFDIFVMDTLSQYVDPHSLSLVGASAPMNIWTYYNGINEVVKFDFPNINLLDSSHHNQCNGMLVFNINTKTGLANGMTIFNRAGIFFDDNPVVMTNTVEDIIGIPVLSTGNAKQVATHVSIYPNPATDELTIKMDQGAYTSFAISNSIGQQMIQEPLSTTQTQVNVKMLPAGVYYITFRGDNGTSVQKFVKG